MTKRMLIDATHAEETRVVVLDGNRLEDFDVETSTKRQLKGNIYLAKVVRVEPSLQAAFVEYGGNRHGFLAFSEIHPDYYQIPVADRQRLIEQEAEEAQREEEEADRELESGSPAWTPPEASRSDQGRTDQGRSEGRSDQGRSEGRSGRSRSEHSRHTPSSLGQSSAEPAAHSATAQSPVEQASFEPLAPVETSDESGATAELLHDSAGEPEPPAAMSDTFLAPPGSGDSVTGYSFLGGTAAPAADATEPVTGDLVSDLGDGVAGAAALAPIDLVVEFTDSVPATAEIIAVDLPIATTAPSDIATAVAPAEASLAGPAQDSPAGGSVILPPEAGSLEPGIPEFKTTESDSPEFRTPEAGAAEHGASGHGPSEHGTPEFGASEPVASEQRGADRPAAALETPEQGHAPHDTAPHAASDSNDAEPDTDRDPPSRRAQPLIIEPDTLSGPVEPANDHDDPDSFTLREPAETTSEADIEHDADLADDDSESIPESLPPETVGGEPDSADEQRERRPPSRYLRNYKIQEVIRRRQILLVQVVKEERGTKGAALTTYLSLAGRFCVLMPNSPRGGGISRKITSATDRRRLKEVVAELEMPRGMGLIVRTAGANRPKPEIKRDCEYLLRLWDDIREHTLKSVAPALIYEEASLIKRAIRDVYSRDIDEIQVDGEEGWRAAHEFMRMLMPSHAKKVQLWRDPSQPLFTKYQVESQLDGMLQPTVQLRSGGYLVINQAEALVAIDVNSGRSTRERNVEETALRTNLEAADEVARQLRLRDLAGLIVIDFIDMESKKHNAMVERRIKEALKNDRARIQVGNISHFGLLEMSRQRLRPSLAETSFILCPHCGGTGHVRSTESAAIYVLRGIEDEGSKRRSAEIVVHVALPIALYILNHKRDRLREIELRYAMRVTVLGDDNQVASQFHIDRVRPQIARDDALTAITPDAPQAALAAPRYEVEETALVIEEDESEPDDSLADDTSDEENGADETTGEAAQPEGGDGSAEQAERRRRRRRRRRGGRREDGGMQAPQSEVGTGMLLADTDAARGMGAARDEPETGAAQADLTSPETHIEGVPEYAEATAQLPGQSGTEPGGQASSESRNGSGSIEAGSTGSGSTGSGGTEAGNAELGGTHLGGGQSGGTEPVVEPTAEDDARRRRGRRGGRRRRREPGEGENSPFAAPGAEQPDLPAVYIGPTPANPFGGHAFDIFDVLEQAEASAAVRPGPAEPVVRQARPDAASDLDASNMASVALAATQESVAGRSEPASTAATAQEIVNATAPEPAVTGSMGEVPAVKAAAPAAAEPAAYDASATGSASDEPMSDGSKPVGSAPDGSMLAGSMLDGSTTEDSMPEGSMPEGATEAGSTTAGTASGDAGAAEPSRPATTRTESSAVELAAPEQVPSEMPPSATVRLESTAAVPTSAAAPATEVTSIGAPEADPAPSEATPGAATLSDKAPPAQERSGSSQDQPMPSEVANDVTQEPAIRPIIIGSGEALAEKKRGWWRR